MTLMIKYQAPGLRLVSNTHIQQRYRRSLSPMWLVNAPCAAY